MNTDQISCKKVPTSMMVRLILVDADQDQGEQLCMMVAGGVEFYVLNLAKDAIAVHRNDLNVWTSVALALGLNVGVDEAVACGAWFGADIVQAPDPGFVYVIEEFGYASTPPHFTSIARA